MGQTTQETARMNQLDMKGRHGVVTGGATGLGFAIAERMVASGARVTLWDRDIGGMGTAAELIKARHPGAQIACVSVDVTSHPAVVQATAQTVAIAPVDALVNCAGISGPNVKLWDYGVEDWQQVMNVNIMGVFYGCREIVPHMRERKFGRIVNIASVAGKEGNPNASAYSTSKAAVIGLTKSLGKELADLDIKVSTSSSCSTKSPWGALAPPKKSPPWWSGCAPKTARSAPGRYLTSRAGAPPIDCFLKPQENP
jgi:NAD(P)-dependent dehydrogenase (short-subunit alcohol dehydrogenase family)